MHNLQNEYVKCTVQQGAEPDELLIRGTVTAMARFDMAEIFAANPIDRMMNYTGSGLPFPCSRIAFEGTPNYHIMTDKSGAFDVVFKYPNSYYTEDQYTRIMPSIFFKLSRRADNSDPVFVRFELPFQDDTLTMRTLTYRGVPRKGPESYSAKEYIIPISTAEETMRRYKDVKIQHDLA